jgi:hypothetical protein
MARPEFAATVAEGRYTVTRFRVEAGMTGRAEEVDATWGAMLAQKLGAAAG